jgi:hypothetical protein
MINSPAPVCSAKSESDQFYSMCTRWCRWLRRCATSRKVAVSIGSLGFFIDLILPAALWPGLESASDRNEYQEYLLEVKRLVHRADNLATFMCRLSRNSGSLNLLEPSGPVQACIGTAVPFLRVLQAD